MVGKYKVITLCGSTRFRDAFMDAQKRLTLEGSIVINVGGYIDLHKIRNRICKSDGKRDSVSGRIIRFIPKSKLAKQYLANSAICLLSAQEEIFI